MVEGDGDVEAVPKLVASQLRALQGDDTLLFPDQNCIKVQNLGKLVRDDFHFWKRQLQNAVNRGNLGAVLLLLDGDAKYFQQQPFCPASCAQVLAAQSRECGAGHIFSVGIVFACQEYESWLVAGIDHLAGAALGADRATVPPNLISPDNDGQGLRGAKEWLSSHLDVPYKETLDQAQLTSTLIQNDALQCVAERNRSFRRFQHAMEVMVEAVRSDSPVVTPPIV